MSTNEPATKGDQPTPILEETHSPRNAWLGGLSWDYWICIVTGLFMIGESALRRFITFAFGEIWSGWTLLQDHFCGCMDVEIQGLYFILKYAVVNGIAWLMALFILETIVTYVHYNIIGFSKVKSNRKN